MLLQAFFFFLLSAAKFGKRSPNGVGFIAPLHSTDLGTFIRVLMTKCQIKEVVLKASILAVVHDCEDIYRQPLKG